MNGGEGTQGRAGGWKPVRDVMETAGNMAGKEMGKLIMSTCVNVLVC